MARRIGAFGSWVVIEQKIQEYRPKAYSRAGSNPARMLELCGPQPQVLRLPMLIVKYCMIVKLAD